MKWVMLHPKATLAHLGFIPSFLDENDPRRAVEQLHENYQHGGGWIPLDGFKLIRSIVLRYPGDPPLTPLAATHLRQELIVVYDNAVVAVFQPDRSFVAAIMD
jgi:hypothetical protein